MPKTEEQIKEMEDLEKKIYKEAANVLLDWMCDVEGIDITISILINSGFNDDALLLLNFSKEDIEKVRNSISKEG